MRLFNMGAKIYTRYPAWEDLGLVEYDEESWHRLNPPVDGKYARVSLCDFRTVPERLKVASEVIAAARAARSPAPAGHSARKPRTSVAALTDEELLRVSGEPTVEYPIRVLLAGKYLYERYFATREEALGVVELLRAGQPLNHERDVDPFGFTFF